MRRWGALLVLLGSAVALRAQQNPNENAVQQKFAPGGSIRLHLEAGGYTISPSDLDNIVVTYRAQTTTQLSRVKVEIKPAGSTADINVSHTPTSNFSVTVEVPRHSNLWARLTAGQLDVQDVEGDKDLEIWAGQLDVEILHPEVYGHCDASVLAGSLEAPAFNASKGGLFRSFHNQGPGKYRLHAHVTTGEIDLHGSQ